MKERFEQNKTRTTSDFGAAAFLDHGTFTALAKHLARISAENDYRDFLKSQKPSYNSGLKKGPGS